MSFAMVDGWGSRLALLVGVVAGAGPANAQTFSQVLDLGSDVGPRLTMTVTQSRIQRRLFGRLGGMASWIDATGGSPTVYQFATDTHWSKVLFSKKDHWIRQFDNEGGPGGRFNGPPDLEVSGSGHVFVADPYKSRVLVAAFDGEDLTAVTSIMSDLRHPVAVGWDGGTTPLTTRNLYVLEGSLSTVSYWTHSSGAWVRQWTYGSRGTGTGQFRYPSGACVRHDALTPSASSVFGTDFYVVDAGNRRVVWLKREGASATWKGTASIPEGWLPVSCTVDHFGIVYVADKQNHRLVSYTWNLDEITRYGSYGTGASNLNTFAYPHDVHIPFGKKVVGGQTIWYGEGRILTAEQWGPESGALEHWLGVEIPWANAYPSAWGPELWYRTTGMAYHTVRVYAGTHQAGDQPYSTVWEDYLLTPTWFIAPWDGRAPDGSYAPEGLYHFHVTATSAYGCQGQAWCQPSAWTTPVSWEGPPNQDCENLPPGEYCVPDPDGSNVALPLDEPILAALPTAYRLGQVLTPYRGPLLRLDGVGGAAAQSATMSSAEAVASVRAQGIRALAVDVPSEGTAARVTVRLYSLTGRLVRILVDETVEPGSYVVGWDGEDASGRPAPPGVYLAVMTAGGYRGTQRLLLK